MPCSSASPCPDCDGRCCYYRGVPVTGYDAYTIASTLKIGMEQFLVFWPERKQTDEGFKLQRAGPTFTLGLNKRHSRRKQKPCIFLIRLRGGTGRCGIYSLRPQVCQIFPAELRDGKVAWREKGLVCPKKTWNTENVNLAPWRASLLREELERAIHRAVVRRWNGLVESGPEEGYCIEQYFAYVMEAYKRLERAREQVTAEQMAAMIELQSEIAPAPRGPATPARRRSNGLGMETWRRFMTRVREQLRSPALVPTPA
jgi:Fe-S-cluster containining protein